MKLDRLSLNNNEDFVGPKLASMVMIGSDTLVQSKRTLFGALRLPQSMYSPVLIVDCCGKEEKI